jgi:hypothetical protein
MNLKKYFEAYKNGQMKADLDFYSEKKGLYRYFRNRLAEEAKKILPPINPLERLCFYVGYSNSIK